MEEFTSLIESVGIIGILATQVYLLRGDIATERATAARNVAFYRRLCISLFIAVVVVSGDEGKAKTIMSAFNQIDPDEVYSQ